MASNSKTSAGAVRSPTPTHPPYSLMIREALTSLNEQEGSTETSISQYIKENFEGLPPGHDRLLPYYINKLINQGEFVHGQHGRYCLPSDKKVQDPIQLRATKNLRKLPTKKNNDTESNGTSDKASEKEDELEPCRRKFEKPPKRKFSYQEEAISVEPLQILDDNSMKSVESKHDSGNSGLESVLKRSQGSLKKNKIKKLESIYSELSDSSEKSEVPEMKHDNFAVDLKTSNDLKTGNEPSIEESPREVHGFVP